MGLCLPAYLFLQLRPQIQYLLWIFSVNGLFFFIVAFIVFFFLFIQLVKLNFVWELHTFLQFISYFYFVICWLSNFLPLVDMLTYLTRFNFITVINLAIINLNFNLKLIIVVAFLINQLPLMFFIKLFYWITLLLSFILFSRAYSFDIRAFFKLEPTSK